MRFKFLIFPLILSLNSLSSFATTVAPVDSAIDPLDSAMVNEDEKMDDEKNVAVDDTQIEEFSDTPPVPLDNDDL